MLWLQSCLYNYVEITYNLFWAQKWGSQFSVCILQLLSFFYT